MKFKKAAAALCAAVFALTAVSATAFAEDAADNKISLMTAELTTQLKTNMVFVEGVGVVDITGEDFDSSENGAASMNSTLDVDFDGLAYLSKEDLKNWQETGVLTLSKLKADFDTTGLKWGMFHAENGYVQLVKMEKQMVEDDWGNEQEENVVTYRGLYKIEDNEIKKVCDLDTFWTTTREDGISVGLDTVKKDVHIVYDDFETEFKATVELKMVVTQPDGTREETVLAKASDFDSEINASEVNVDELTALGYCSWSIPSSGDTLANVGIENQMLYVRDPNSRLGYTIENIYKDGTRETIYENDNLYYTEFTGFLGSTQKYLLWCHRVPVMGNSLTVFSYNCDTKAAEVYGHDTFKDGENWFLDENGQMVYSWNFKTEGNYDGHIVTYISTRDADDKPIKEGFTILNGLNDFANWESKTYYNYISLDDVGDEEDPTILYRFETFDGKEGFIDYSSGKETIIGQFDAADNFEGSYAPVVKDGKAYLVDADMNAVSDTVAADDVVSIKDDLFIVKNGDKVSFVTYAGEVKEPAAEAVVVDYSDNGVIVSANKGVIADGAALSVKAVEDKSDDTKVTYEITFKKADGTEVQPNGTVTVKIPVPEAFKDKTIYVYRAETDGTYTDMNAKIADGYVVFETDHFSEYVLSIEKIENKPEEKPVTTPEETKPENKPTTGDTKPADDSNKPTGSAAGIAFAGIALAGAALMVSKKRK